VSSTETRPSRSCHQAIPRSAKRSNAPVANASSTSSTISAAESSAPNSAGGSGTRSKNQSDHSRRDTISAWLMRPGKLA
jgi:hypothetical protein